MNDVKAREQLRYRRRKAVTEAVRSAMHSSSAHDCYRALAAVVHGRPTTAVVIGSALVAIGTFLALIGRTFARVMVFLTGMLAGGAAMYTILAKLYEFDAGMFGKNYELTIGIAVPSAGLVLGMLSLSVFKLAVLLLGALLGVSMAVVLIHTPFIQTYLQTMPQSVYLGLTVLLCIGLIYVAQKVVLMVATAVVGSFTACCGLDVFLKTGFVEQAEACMTFKKPPQSFTVTEKMLPIVLVFVTMVVLGINTQINLSRKRKTSDAPLRKGPYTIVHEESVARAW